jgi:hypothetical protein
VLILNTIREFAGRKTHVGETFPLQALGIAFANFQVTELAGVEEEEKRRQAAALQKAGTLTW